MRISDWSSDVCSSDLPSEAKIWFYLREMDFAAIEKMLTTADTIADGAAKMTSTTVSRRILGVAATQNFNRPMAEAAQANIVAVGLPKWDADDQALDRKSTRLNSSH